jgi:hypothetical protein
MHTPGDSLPFALFEADQRLYEPRDVPLGKNCGCVCPGCRQPVYAKHCVSGKRVPHFAHAPGSDCPTGFETALHLAAKQLIEGRGVLAFPELVVSIKVFDDTGHMHKPEKNLVTRGRRRLTNVVLEKTFGQIRPDVRVEAEGLGAVLVEVAVTHFVDDLKLEQIKQYGIPAIEIDLSKLRDATFAALEFALFENPTGTKWLHHPDEARTRRALLESIQWLLDAATESAAATARERAGIEKAERAERETRQAERAAQRKAEEQKAAERSRIADEAQRRQRNEALRKAAAFKAKPEHEKKQILLRRLGLNELPTVLAADVRGAMSFGVEDPLVWQTTFFGGLIHKQADQGRGWVARNYARAWMRHRFDISLAYTRFANSAIDDYLMKLSAGGALIPSKNASYAIAVADLTCFETMTAVMNDRNFDPTRLQWVTQDQWPGQVQVRVLTEAMVRNKVAAHAWANMANGMRKNIWFPPIEICEWANQLGGTKEIVAKYLIRLGFLRLAPQGGKEHPPQAHL